ncbi:hypothetical protein J7297_01313 [Nakaseomyces glabratus]|nr:hypothetical protein J7297_01313 [Nakaseomyces glabratus]KAH7594535.1 hypothetical protein J7296_01315 [Nakaseomyces glabratus]
MMEQYVPPGKRLFQARHRVSRRDLQHYGETDWTTVKDEVVKDDDLLGYAVPIIDNGDPRIARPFKQAKQLPYKAKAGSLAPPLAYPAQNRSALSIDGTGSPASSTSSIFSVQNSCPEIGDRYSSSTMDSLVEGLDPTLKFNMQRNISVDSLIQDNNKRISEHRDSLALLKEYEYNERKESNRSSKDYYQSGIDRIENETKRELRRLRYENRALLQREDALAKVWRSIRNCKDDGALLLALRKHHVYWFGIPSDLRLKVYKLCLYQDGVAPPVHSLGAALCKRLGDVNIVKQIIANINKEVPWLLRISGTGPMSQDSRTSPSEKSQAAVLETKMYGSYPGLYYHLKDKLHLDICEQFMKPLLRTVLLRILYQCPHDVATLELLDIVVVSMHYHELQTVLLDQMLNAILQECHFKFFHETLHAINNEIKSTELDVFRFLETLRKPHAEHL